MQGFVTLQKGLAREPAAGSLNGPSRISKQVAECKVSADKPLPQVLRNTKLPYSVFTLKQAYREQTKQTWHIEWTKSPRYANLKTAAIDSKLPPASATTLCPPDQEIRG